MTRRAICLLAALVLAGAGTFVADGAGAPPAGGRVRPPGTRGPATSTAPASMPSTANATWPGPWADAKVGTLIKIQRDGNTVETQEVVKDDGFYVTVRTTLNVAGVKPTERQHPRRFPPELVPLIEKGFGRKVGQETLRVDEQDLPCTVYEQVMTVGDKKITSKVWHCSAVPGWTVRIDNDATGERKTIFQVTEFTK